MEPPPQLALLAPAPVLLERGSLPPRHLHSIFECDLVSVFFIYNLVASYKSNNMTSTQLQIEEIHQTDFDLLRPLVEEFIVTHKSLSFRQNYWTSFCDWLVKCQSEGNTLSLRAIINNKTVGFIIGIIQENGPLISPERVGYVSIMVVDKSHRAIGIGNALWTELRNWFLSKDIKYFELNTEFGNTVSGSFWKNRGFNTFLERRRYNSED
jgi:GNAT superfamily N-acetyltransferase